jgi:hypothetical protein
MNYMRLVVTDKDVINDNDIIAHRALEDEIIDVYGITDRYRNYLDAARKLANAQNDYVITRNRKFFNAMRHFENEVEKCLKDMQKGLTPQRVLIKLSEKLAGGRPIGPKEITLRQYLDMIEEYERGD